MSGRAPGREAGLRTVREPKTLGGHMTEHRAGTGTSIVAGQPLDDRERPEIDTSLPHSARVYDHWLGPKAARYWAGVARKP